MGIHISAPSSSHAPNEDEVPVRLKPVTLRLDPVVEVAIKKVARNQEVTPSVIMRKAIRHYLASFYPETLQLTPPL